MPTPAGGLRNLNVVHLRRSHDRSHFPFPAIFAERRGAGGARTWPWTWRLRRYERQRVHRLRRSRQIRSVRVQATGAGAQEPRRPRGGVAGPVVAELAYRNDYIAVRGQAKLAEEAWQRNKCVATPAPAPAAASTPPAKKT